ncbi:DUF4349 domain-containing protein [Mycobacterium camsae]|uniref:DUF4349 domain-containing protein n=1 Tax=Mycobacterium gordonae TaxID=1778 RepID=UPI00197D6E3B|nr:DUF4349 domain-containing protein [Mycobacterium gordonae]
MTVRITSTTDVEAQCATDGPSVGTLRTERGKLPLDRIDVRADITGLTSQIEVTQEFVNTFDGPLEASYVFPLPDRAAVTGMRMTANGRAVAAALAERESARRDYDRAVTAGRRASIAEEERPDVFTMRVGNILPGEKVSVAITLVSPLTYADGEATFRFPLVVAPRHISGEPLDDVAVGDGYAHDTDAVPDASRITPPVLLPGFARPVALTIDVGIDPAGLTLSEVRSSLPTEPADGGRIRIVPGQRADRDLVLRLRYGADDITDSLLLIPDADGEEGTYQLTVLPPPSGASLRPRDLVLLLDHSASMGGWKMSSARRAAARIIDTLTSADRFAVLTFNDRIERPAGLPGGLIEATDRNRFRAVEHLAGVESEGGSELLAPLRAGLELLRESRDRDRVVILVTDGQVGNEDQVLRGLTADLRRVRVVAVGVDQAVNAGFLSRLATAGGGHCELVESEDRLDEAMEAIHRRVAAPLAHSLSVHCDGLSVIDNTTTPARLPDALAGVPLVVSGRYRGAAEGSMIVRGRDRSGAEWSVSVAGQCREAPALTAVWARAHLRDLEDRYASASGNSSAAELGKRIVDTSLRFGVLCRFTAYVSLDGPIVATGELPHRVMQPVEAPAGWDLGPIESPVSVAGGSRPSVKTAQARTVKLRNVIVVAVLAVLVLGGGWVWSVGRGGPSIATRDGVVGGKLTETPDPRRAPASGTIPETMGGGIADQSTVNPAPLAPPPDENFKRDIVTNGSLRLVVRDPGAVAERLVAAVNDAGGRVDSRSEQSGASSPVVGITMRIPADKLDGLLADAKKLGTVQSMSITHTDVTTQRVDLDARIDALQTSVRRLLELMGKAGNVADLLAAESSLTQRQAELDSLKAQRGTLHDEIDYATITVNISAESTVSHPGFFGELDRGWHSVLAAAHGGLLRAGFLVPWLALLALPVLGLVLVMRRMSVARASGGAATEED